MVKVVPVPKHRIMVYWNSEGEVPQTDKANIFSKFLNVNYVTLSLYGKHPTTEACGGHTFLTLAQILTSDLGFEGLESGYTAQK
jgi:hypothetical protein